MAPGYKKFDENRVLMVIQVRLLKNLYGLRQSPSNWWGALSEHQVEIVFKSRKSGQCIYIFSVGLVVVILTFYVGDVLLLGKGLKVRG